MNDFEIFTKNLFSSEDISAFTDQIELARGLIYRASGSSFLEKVAGKVSGDFEQAVSNLESQGKLPKAPEELDKFLNSLDGFVEKLPRVKIKLAFSPGREFLAKVSGWFEKELGQKIILDISLEPKIIGGMVIEYKGQYRDYSLSNQIENIIKKKQGNNAG